MKIKLIKSFFVAYFYWLSFIRILYYNLELGFLKIVFHLYFFFGVILLH